MNPPSTSTDFTNSIIIPLLPLSSYTFLAMSAFYIESDSAVLLWSVFTISFLFSLVILVTQVLQFSDRFLSSSSIQEQYSLPNSILFLKYFSVLSHFFRFYVRFFIRLSTFMNFYCFFPEHLLSFRCRLTCILDMNTISVEQLWSWISWTSNSFKLTIR